MIITTMPNLSYVSPIGLSVLREPTADAALALKWVIDCFGNFGAVSIYAGQAYAALAGQ
jgi:hypothetical protein